MSEVEIEFANALKNNNIDYVKKNIDSNKIDLNKTFDVISTNQNIVWSYKNINFLFYATMYCANNEIFNLLLKQPYIDINNISDWNNGLDIFPMNLLALTICLNRQDYFDNLLNDKRIRVDENYGVIALLASHCNPIQYFFDILINLKINLNGTTKSSKIINFP